MAIKTKTKEDSPPKEARVYASGIDKVRDEMADSKAENIRLLGEGVTAMIQLHPEWDGHVLAEGKTLSGALSQVRKNAKGGCSDPLRTTTSLLEYYGISCDNPRRLCLEVCGLLAGGDTEAGEKETTSSVTAGAVPPSHSGEGFGEPVADPFDLDALLSSATGGLSPSTPAVPGETRAPDLSEGAGREMGGM